MKHYSTQELLVASDKAPIQIQEAFSSETTISTISNLGNKFRLHIDQIGLVAELNVQTLLGLIDPEGFLKELVAAGIADKDARDIMAEINQKIFVPLREGMRSGAASTPPPTKFAVQQSRPQDIIPRVTPVNAGVPNYTPPLQSPMYSRGIQVPSPTNIPQKNFTRPTQSVYSSASNIPSVRPAMVAPPKPMSSDSLLEDHEEPHIEFNKSPVPGLPKWSPPPQNLPGAVMPMDVIPPGGQPSFVMPQMPVTSTLPVPPQKIPPSLAPKSYSSDPYREPIDEK
jgi:hypothetical protein